MVDLVKSKDISKASSGAGIPINGFAPLNVGDAVKYVAPDNSEWLRSGWAETDFASYPDAMHGQTVPKYSVDFSAIEVGSAITGCCLTPTHIYIVGYTSGLVQQYLRSDGSFVATFSVSAQDGLPKDIAYDGNNFYMLGWNNARIYKYDLNWVYSGSNVAVDATPEGLTFDTVSNTLWVITNAGVCKEYSSMVATGRTFSIGGSNRYSITFDGTDFWVTSHNIQNPERYSGDASGTYLSSMSNVNYPYIYGFIEFLKSNQY